MDEELEYIFLWKRDEKLHVAFCGYVKSRLHLMVSNQLESLACHDDLCITYIDSLLLAE
jgi:hypothetical protein